MKPLVYIAGPYSHPDPVENTHNAILAASLLAEDDLCTPIVPHLTMLWHFVDPHPLPFWYGYDLEVLAHCQYVFRIPGVSAGADNEVAEAHRLGIPVVYSVDELYGRLNHPLEIR